MNYYIPEIEEFHIGFEYEFQRIDNTWIKIIDTEYISVYDSINWDIPDGRIRVKKLDRDDILELGWIDDKIYINEWQTFTLTLIGDNEHLELYESDNHGWLSCRFSGKIKNKSELKLLMKILEII